MEENNNPRREFLKKSALVSTALFFAVNPTNSFSFQKNSYIKSRAYAAFDETGILKPWTFQRRAVGDNDILIDIKYASICHSDIHQIKGDWGKQQYPQVPGHEIVGIVSAIGKDVKNFKLGDRVGVGCMVDGSCRNNEEQYCEDTLFTYGFSSIKEPTGITQGGYSNNIVVNSHFAVHIPNNISFENAAPLLCAGVTTYSPLVQDNIKSGMKVGVAGIGGLGHMAVKLAVSKGAEVYAFTTSEDKIEDIKSFGAKEVIVVDTLDKLDDYYQKLDYMISTIPVQFDVGAYSSTIKPYGTFVQVGMPKGFELTLNNLSLASNRVNYRASLIGGMKDTQDVVNYCATNKVLPKIEIIKAEQINEAWQKVLDKKARYRYVIDALTF
ncbi:NAD(P)-dependent alcohol dehydrogenase [Arcobacter lacus]|uniref:NAD(P)-dependent alcohol dehydrogenase n=1 Tax=Arcobacter lacus TaxID=1912876 RepID=UPI0021BB3A70|nr:NAD(P)-dependent alcohol dehydrogenase [Arcobacter lacus]MCT7909949.1 NAD(P)-dependent alcohol dehydrogenase [Arcobacter lacus]